MTRFRPGGYVWVGAANSKKFYAQGLPKVGGQEAYALTPGQAVRNYGNLAPEYAMHGIVFK
ncbi:hypothetical protein ACU635_00255 [[Actinomadura] parvosata]|uniref:hypothetical protein n=1 Tax=[Actinomadura] parvosata TaxID=1955412 RepID=UPI00406CB450